MKYEKIYSTLSLNVAFVIINTFFLELSFLAIRDKPSLFEFFASTFLSISVSLFFLKINNRSMESKNDAVKVKDN